MAPAPPRQQPAEPRGLPAQRTLAPTEMCLFMLTAAVLSLKSPSTPQNLTLRHQTDFPSTGHPLEPWLCQAFQAHTETATINKRGWYPSPITHHPPPITHPCPSPAPTTPAPAPARGFAPHKEIHHLARRQKGIGHHRVMAELQELSPKHHLWGNGCREKPDFRQIGTQMV